jgi:hypothetical protein
LAELVQFDSAAHEPGQILRQCVLDPDLRCRLRLPTDHLQRLPPLRHVPHVRVQGPHRRDHEIRVQPPPTGFETVHDGCLLGQLNGRTTGRGPSLVYSTGDPFIGRVPRPDLQGPEPFDEFIEGVGLARVRNCGERLVR